MERLRRCRVGWVLHATHENRPAGLQRRDRCCWPRHPAISSPSGVTAPRGHSCVVHPRDSPHTHRTNASSVMKPSYPEWNEEGSKMRTLAVGIESVLSKRYASSGAGMLIFRSSPFWALLEVRVFCHTNSIAAIGSHPECSTGSHLSVAARSFAVDGPRGGEGN